MTLPNPTTVLCTLCNRREACVGRACWRCRDLVNDLLDPANTGSRYNPRRPDDPVVWPSIPALLRRLDAQRGNTGPQVGGTSVFRSTSPANDHIIALRDRRTTADEEFTALAAMRWLAYTADELCHHDQLAEAVAELRTLRTQLLGVTGNALARPVGTCRQLVDADGTEIPEPLVAAAFAAVEPPWLPDNIWRCAWPLYVPVLPPRAPDEPVIIPTLRCGSCRHLYTGYELVQLGTTTGMAVAA